MNWNDRLTFQNIYKIIIIIIKESVLLSIKLQKFFFQFLEDISPFCGDIDTIVLDVWWHLSWVWKPGWIPFVGVLSYPSDSQIHLWCYICWLYGGQHGSRVFSIYVLKKFISQSGSTHQQASPRIVLMTRQLHYGTAVVGRSALLSYKLIGAKGGKTSGKEQEPIQTLGRQKEPQRGPLKY